MTDEKHLTAAEIEGGDEMQKRMQLYTPGQASWPVPPYKDRCFSCAHYRQNKSNPFIGTCRMRKQMLPGKRDISFNGSEALVCAKFEKASK